MCDQLSISPPFRKGHLFNTSLDLYYSGKPDGIIEAILNICNNQKRSSLDLRS